MKTTITLLALLFSLNSLFSQNWEVNQFTEPLRYLSLQPYSPVISDNSEKYYSRVKIDSTRMYTDTTVYIYSNDFLHDTCSFTSEECFNRYSGSVLGSKSISVTNGDNYFVYRTDTFLIKTQNSLNSSWHFKNYQNGDYIEAKIINIDTSTIFSGLDSVKTIELFMKNSANDTISHIVNGNIILLSKNHGIAQILDLRKINNTILNHKLTGYGYSPLTYGSVFNFEVGDEFHYSIKYDLYNYYAETREVISKTYSANNDIIYYSFHRKRGFLDSQIEANIDDTINMTVTNLNTIITNTPFFVFNDNGPSNLSYSECNGRFSTKIVGYGGEQYNDSLYIYHIPAKSTNIVDDYTYDYTIYIEGCGKVIYHAYTVNSPTPYANPKEKLKYFKKGNETWGSPYIFTEIPSIIQNENNIKLFPNPTNGIFTISNTSEINKIEIYNTIGNLIISENEINNNQTTVDLENQKAGMYFIKIFSENSYIARKLIKK